MSRPGSVKSATQTRPTESRVVWLHSPRGVRHQLRRLAWRAVPKPLLRATTHLRRFWYALRLEGRSFLGRMQTRLSKEHWGVTLGPIYRESPEGQHLYDARTVARNEGTRTLESVRPWASTTEIQIYLEGFHAGEQFVLGNLDTQSRAVFESSLTRTSPEGGNITPPQAIPQGSKFY